MIRPYYSLQLARTKLGSKRGMLIASIIVASLLFGVLIAIVIIFTGAEKSANNFVKKAGNDHYLLTVAPNIPYDQIAYSGDLTLEQVREIKAFQKQYYTDLRAKYISLGIKYDEKTEVSAFVPAAYKPLTLPEEQRVYLNYQSPVISAINALKYTKYTETATNKFSDLKTIASKYGVTAYYSMRPTYLPMLPNTHVVQNGKEDFGVTEPKSSDPSTYGYYINAVYNSSYSFQDSQLVNRYMLPDNNKPAQGIPVVISAQEAVSLFGKELNISKEPKDIQQKLDWLNTVQTKMNGKTYQACYRNAPEVEMLSKIQRDYAEMKTNAGNKEYVKPSLLYDYPTSACGNIVTKQDTRTALEKKETVEADNVLKKLGTYVAPAHRMLTFEVVGIANAQPFQDSTKSAESYVKNLLSPINNLSDAVIPIQAYNALPENMKIGDLKTEEEDYAAGLGYKQTDEFDQHVIEFSSIEKARKFLTTEACDTFSSNCSKKFLASPFGSNYLILDEIGKLFSKVASIAFPAILALAAIIIWFTVSRIMADNRKETAVYRAMGAKRIDITAIYISYILIIALFIAIASLTIGIIAAYIVDLTYGAQLTGTATAAFGIVKNAPQFSLFSLDSSLLWLIVASIFVVSLVASIQPLIRNVLRSPIRDMREE